LAFVRISSHAKIIPAAVSPPQALVRLRKIVSLPAQQFWADDVAPIDATRLSSLALVGHRQLTDGYLLALAKHHGGKLATFAGGVAELQSHQDRASCVATIG
jgi:predicted nucleic acid-binding protein